MVDYDPEKELAYIAMVTCFYGKENMKVHF